MKQHRDKILGLLWLIAFIIAGITFMWFLTTHQPERTMRYIAIWIGFIFLVIVTANKTCYYSKKEAEKHK